MSKYFDNNFFKFFWGFVAIVVVSLVLIVIGKLFQEKETNEESNQRPNVAKSTTN